MFLRNNGEPELTNLFPSSKPPCPLQPPQKKNPLCYKNGIDIYCYKNY